MDNQLILGDSLEVLKSFPDNFVDAIVTDPPYMTTDLDFDKIGFSISEFLLLCKCKLKTDGYLVSFGSIKLLGTIANIFPVRWSGFWLKPSGTMRTATAKKPMSQSEPYCVYAHPDHKICNLVFNKIKRAGDPYVKKMNNTGYLRTGKSSIDRSNTSAWTKQDYIYKNDGFRYQTDVIFAPNKSCMKHKERTIHPTQKPIFLIETLIEFCTNENQLVLDPFGGSGTTAIACLNTRRKYIVIEKEPEYYEIAKKRISEYETVQQLSFELD